jgi:hypothetical protein
LYINPIPGRFYIGLAGFEAPFDFELSVCCGGRIIVRLASDVYNCRRNIKTAKETEMKRTKFLSGMLAMALVLGMAGCDDIVKQIASQVQDAQPEGGVLTVTGAGDGIQYEADVYKYSKAVTDAAEVKEIISDADLAGTGVGTSDGGTLEISLVTLGDEDFTSDGKFLVVLTGTDDDASAPLKYKAAVTFIGGSATLKYSALKAAADDDADDEPAAGDEPVTDKPNVATYTVTFDTGAGGSIVPEQSVAHGNAATRPATNPTGADGHGFDDWYVADAEAPYGFNSPVTSNITLYAKWKPLTFAVLIADIAADAAANTAKTYTLPSGNDTYNAALTLTTANSPASVVIYGGNRVITGSANRITVGEGVTLTLKNITFKTLPLTVAAGGTLVLDTGAIVTESTGAGVTVDGGTLETKAGSSVTENGDSGVRIEGTGGVFTMTGGEIYGNTAPGYGGGVMISGERSAFTMNGGSIHGNTAPGYGGGVAVWGANSVFTMNGGKISDHNARYGGGVYMWGVDGVFNMTGGEIYGNRVNINGGDGGGVYADPYTHVTFNMSGGRIRDNTSTWAGSGVYIPNGTFNMTGGEIYANTSEHNWDHNGAAVVGTVHGNYVIGVADESRGSIRDNSPADVEAVPEPEAEPVTEEPEAVTEPEAEPVTDKPEAEPVTEDKTATDEDTGRGEEVK